jgi:hypothetical protein
MKTPSHLFTAIIAVLATSLLALACGGTKTFTKEELDAKRRAEYQAQQEAEERARLEAEAEAARRWTGPIVGLEQPLILFAGKRVKLDNRNVFVELKKSEWSEMQIGDTVKHNGTAHILVIDGTEQQEVDIDEGSDAAALGYRFFVEEAYEKYIEEDGEYKPYTKLVIRKDE